VACGGDDVVKNILMPIDGSAKSLQSVKMVQDLFAPSDANLTLLTVRDDIDSRSSVILEQMARETRPNLEAIARDLVGYDVKTVVEFGLPGERIIHYAHTHETDIIVMTTRTHKLRNAFMGSVAVYLVKHSRCPIIVVPENKELSTSSD
jgi:nucleotide-binding universal stress UspA family protein